ncbi:MAG: HD domain-containing protein [Thermodesulfobacteriota bacterium]|nr:HD domain-containing protein [Thermodesulfobacteriota bacterium]
MLSEKEKLDTLANLMVELNQVSDLDILMEHILTQARRFVNADAGSIYIAYDDSLQFTYTQNDTLQKRLAKGEKLIYSTFTLPINEQSIAGYVAATGRPLNIKDVYSLESDLPYNFSREFDVASKYKTHSVLTIPLKAANGDVLGAAQIINAMDADNKVISFSEKDEKMMMHFAGIASVALERAKMTRANILRMIKMAEMRDPKETGAHVNRVGAFAVEIYEQWALKRNLSRKEIDKNRDVLRMAAMLHDVGKVAISDVILKKPGRFSKDEFEIMKQHTVLGARLFLDRQSDFDKAALIVALTHHERWDGKGYPGPVNLLDGRAITDYTNSEEMPGGIKEGEIPLFGRIVAIADVYDALSTVRTYKEAWNESEVLSVIEKEAGFHFDPEIVEVFFSSLDMIRAIQERYKDNH